MDGMIIPFEDRLYELVERLVWRMTMGELRYELIERMIKEFEAKPYAELREMFREEGIASRVGEDVP